MKEGKMDKVDKKRPSSGEKNNGDYVSGKSVYVEKHPG